jgi:hypothetical protein
VSAPARSSRSASLTIGANVPTARRGDGDRARRPGRLNGPRSDTPRVEARACRAPPRPSRCASRGAESGYDAADRRFLSSGPEKQKSPPSPPRRSLRTTTGCAGPASFDDCSVGAKQQPARGPSACSQVVPSGHLDVTPAFATNGHLLAGLPDARRALLCGGSGGLAAAGSTMIGNRPRREGASLSECAGRSSRRPRCLVAIPVRV